MAETATLPAIEPQTGQGDVFIPRKGLGLTPEAAQRQIESRITTATARELALKSHEARRAAASQPSQEQQPAAPALDTALALRVRVIERLIDETVLAFDEADTAKDRQALCMSLDRLYGTWSLLTGHEKPGVRKSSTKSKTRPQYQNLPEPDPE